MSGAKTGICFFFVAILACFPVRAQCLPIDVKGIMDAYQASPGETNSALATCTGPFASNRVIQFAHNDVTIIIQHNGYDILSVRFKRTGSFNSFEISDLIKPLGVGQDWTQKGDSDWELEGTGFTAHWKDDVIVVAKTKS